MKIRSGIYEVIESGFINAPSMEDLEFTLNENPLMILVLRVKKSPTPESTIEVIVEGDERLAIIFTNPAVQLNFGPQSPLKLGSINGRALFAALRVTVVGDYSSYQASYSFFLGEEEK